MEGYEFKRECIDTIVALAERNRLTRIWYQKLSESAVTVRVIEPYQFLESQSSLCIRGWQVSPPCEGEEESWRCFRCDRILDVSDGGGTFEPRRPVSLAGGQIDPFLSTRRRAKAKPQDAYRKFLLDAIRDHQLTEREQTQAGNLAEKVATKDLKVVHAQVMAEVLMDALMDFSISEEEEAFLDQVRGFMETVGWAP